MKVTAAASDRAFIVLGRKPRAPAAIASRATLREAVPDRIATGRGSIRPRITASPASPSIPGMS